MSSQGENSDPASISAQVDLLCDQFQSAWNAGTAPDLATYLLEVTESSRPLAFGELLRVELELRRARGDLPALDEYQRRFPQQASLVAEAFHSLQRRELDTIFTPQAPLASGFHVRCPHCHNPIELVPDAELESIHCQSCGSDFSLTSDAGAATHNARGVITLGHFKLVERVGMGAFGSVWKALDTELDRTVAIKIPRAGQLEKQQQDFFFREARSAAQLRHPNIVPVYEVGREGETLYIVSEFVRGVTLGDWLTGQKVTNREAAELCSKIADALHHAHEQGVIHRDLKPANIMIDGEGEPHLMDFGLARREAGEITMTLDGQILGTPAYMSPEQAQGESHAADCRSDVYSIGAILFQLLTGELPFRGNTRMLIHQVIHDEPPSPRKLNSSVPRDLETITLKCLEKEPAKRFQTANEFSSECRRYLSGDPIRARPISRIARTWRWAKRRPAAATLLTVLAGVAVVGPVVATQQALLRVQRDRLLTDVAAQKSSIESASEKLRKTNDELGTRNEELQNQLVRNLIERGTAQCEAGRFLKAVAFFAGAHAMARPDDPLRASARNLAAGWSANLGRTLMHDSFIDAVAFSPDGRTVLTGSYDKTARLWDAATGKPIGEPLRHDDVVWVVAFSPDGRTVLTGSDDRTARIWNATTGKPIGEPLRHEDRVLAVAFSPDGRMVLTGSRDKTARLWDAATGKPIGEPLHHDNWVWAVAFSPDGRLVLTGSHDKTARLWDAATGKPIGDPLRHDAELYAVAFSPDGRMVLTGSRDKTARLWDAATGKRLGALMRHDDVVWAVAFSPDGHTVLTGSYDTTARLWDAATGKPICQPLRHNNAVTAVAFSPDGRTVLTGSSDNTARLWDSAMGKPIGEPLRHDGPVAAVAFSPDGCTVLTGSSDNTARLWDAAAGKPFGKPLHAELHAVAFSPDGRTVLTGSRDKTARLWDAATGKPIGEPLRHDGEVTAVAFSPDGRTVLTGCWDKSARFWDAATGKPIGEQLRHDGGIYAVAFSPDGRTVLTGSTDNTARLWDVATDKPTGGPLRHNNAVTAVAFNPDGRTALTGSHDKTARLWDAATGKPIGEPLQHDDVVWAVAFSPDGRTVLTGSGDNTARLWDSATGKPIVEPLHHDGWVKAVAFSPDGRTVLTGSTDNTAHLWDVATGKPTGLQLRYHGMDNAVAFSPDGRTVLTGSSDARLWQVPQLPDNSELVKSWAAVKTGLSLDAQGLMRRLSQAEWLKACEELEKLRSELPDAKVLSWMDRRVVAGYAPYGRRRVVLDDVANGLFFRTMRSAVQTGPDAINQLINAGIARPGEEAPEPRDALVLGELRLLGGNRQSAEAAIRAAIKRDGTKPYYYKSLGWCLLAEGKTEEARQAFEKVLKDRPRKKDGTYDLDKAGPDQMTAAYFLNLVTEQQYIDSLASDKRLACFPWFYVAQRREIEGKKDAAIKAYERCVELGAGNNPHLVRALAEWRLWKLKESPKTQPTPAMLRPFVSGSLTPHRPDIPLANAEPFYVEESNLPAANTNRSDNLIKSSDQTSAVVVRIRSKSNPTINNDSAIGTYINIEKGSVEVTPILKGWVSALWILAPTGGLDGHRFITIQNQWRLLQFLKVDDGKLQCGSIAAGSLSGRWELEPTTDTYVKIKNHENPKIYLQMRHGKLEAGPIESNSDSAEWEIRKVPEWNTQGSK